MLRALAYDSGKSLSLELGASQTIVKGDGLVWSSGYLVAAAAGEEIFDYVAQEAKTTAGGKYTFIDVLPASGSNIQYEVDTYANTAEAQRGVAYEAKTKSQIDNGTSATANGFFVEQIVGAAANKKVIGRFL